MPASHKDPAIASRAAATEAYLRARLDDAVFPGAVWLVGSSERVLFEGAVGDAVVLPERITAQLDTIYDVASLTKPVVTTTLALQAHSEGKIDLDEPVSDVVDELRGTDKEALTWVDLLSHRGGLEAWYPLYVGGEGDAAYLETIRDRPLVSPPRETVTYSDLGFVLVHQALERVYSRAVEELAWDRIFEPLGMGEAGFNPRVDLRSRIAATEWGNASERAMVAGRGLEFGGFRDWMIHGEVHDGNAWHMGGLAGNAGLFSTARDLWRFASAFVRGEIVAPELVDRATRNQTRGIGDARGLGWQLRSSREGHPSFVLSDRAFGHTGFTGTSLFVDPAVDRIFVLLTNRVHPSMRPGDFQLVRRAFHEIAS